MSRSRHLVRAALATLALAATAGVLPGTAAALPSCSLPAGSGTTADPYLIATAADLAYLSSTADCWAKSFRQTADIDLTGVTWNPIGGGPSFTGTYDGGGHVISNLTISGVSHTGLFGALDGATVSHLTLDHATVSAIGASVGALAGSLTNSTATDVAARNSTVTGTTLNQASGGLFGSVETSTVSRATAAVDVQTNAAPAGGLAGWVSGSTITDSSASGSVTDVQTNSAPAGGLAGWVSGSTISGSAASGPVTAVSAAGGLVGSLCPDSSIARGTATGDVASSGSSAGGLVGEATDSGCGGPTGAITDSHATGGVTATGGDAGGLAGSLDGVAVRRSYATGTTTSTTGAAGGLVGRTAGTGIEDSYALSRAHGALFAGGLIGRATCSAVMRAYAAGAVVVDPGGAAGGLVGSDVANTSLCDQYATSSYWDSQATGQATSVLGSARTTAQLHDIATFTAGYWSIATGKADPATTTWGICPSANGGYPYLQWQLAGLANPCPPAPAAAIPTASAPTPKLVVTSTRRAGRSAVTSLRISAPGTVTQLGKALGSGRVVCRATPVVMTKAGTAVLTCTLTAYALRRLHYGALRVRLVTRYVPTGGAPATTTRVVRFARIAGVRPVTG